MMDIPDDLLSKEDIHEIWERTKKIALLDGYWKKVCKDCKMVVGGRLVKYGRPSEKDLSRCACPHCGTVGNVEAVYVPPEEAENTL